MKAKGKIGKIFKFVNAPVAGTSALKLQADDNIVDYKPRVKTLKKKYVKPKAEIVEVSTQKSPVMGCWNCGEDGIHC